MQFKVPQDVQREDRIVGPLTLRQLIMCGIGFSIAYAIYTVLGRDYELITVLIPVIIIALITVTFAFIKPLNLNFEKYILYALEYYFILPKKRYWLKGTGDPLTTSVATTTKKEAPKTKTPEKNTKNRSVEDLSKILDS
jgi:hypothetical protein